MSSKSTKTAKASASSKATKTSTKTAKTSASSKSTKTSTKNTKTNTKATSSTKNTKTTASAKNTKATSSASASTNLSTEQIQKWAENLKNTLVKFKNSVDATEDYLQQMASKVKSSGDTTLYQSLLDLRSLTETTHRQLGNFQYTLSSQLNAYLKKIGASQSNLSDKLKNNDQFKENAQKIAKLTIN